MNSLKQFFSYMNDISFPYVVLRNWDKLPYDVALGEHSDLDILVYDFGHWKEIFPQAKQEFPYPRVRFKVPIDDSYIYIDVRHVGDDYYPQEFEKAVLETRVWNDRGFFTPNPIHHRIALAYHIVHHKGRISDDYRRFIGNVTIKELLDVLKLSAVGWVKPKDLSVGDFNGYWKGATSIVDRQDGYVRKKQVSYSEYDLIKKEATILKQVDSIHFPKLIDYTDDQIVVEDCGNPLLSNLPDNWKEQLSEIIDDLDKYNLIHRDIRLDNLLVKDGVIKLIDFGWAKFEHEIEEKEPPACLGFPNKPSWGWDDIYSINQVIRQIDYMIYEQQEKKLCG